MQSFPSLLKREGAGLRTRVGFAGGWAGALTHLLVIVTFGIFLPSMRGIDFLDPVMVDAYACIGILFAAPAAAQGFAAERPATFSEALARVAVSALYGEVMVIAMLMAALATVYFEHPRIPIAPDVVSLAEANAFGLAASVACAAIAGWFALRFSAGASRMAMRVIFLGLLILFFFYSRWLPDAVGRGALAAAAAATAGILALRAELRR